MARGRDFDFDQGDFPAESHRSRVELSYLEQTMERRQKFVKLELQWKPLEMEHSSHQEFHKRMVVI